MEKNCGPERSAFPHLLYMEFTHLHCSSHPKEVRISPISINQSLFVKKKSLLLLLFPSVSTSSLSCDICSIIYIISPLAPQGNGFLRLMATKVLDHT